LPVVLRGSEVLGYEIKGDQAMWIGLSLVIKGDLRWAGKSLDDPLSPETFNPDRFLPFSSPNDLGSQQLVLGAGRHQCLGMHLALVEFKVFLAVLARGYSYRILSQGASAGPEGRKMLSLFPDLSSATIKQTN
jgi:hypothetical protein